MCASGSCVHGREQPLGRIEYGDRTRDAKFAIGCRGRVPPLGQAAQFRQPEDALHAGRRSESQRCLGRDRRQSGSAAAKIAGQDLVGRCAYSEASGERKCGRWIIG